MGQNDRILLGSELSLAVAYPTKCKNINLTLDEDFLGRNLWKGVNLSKNRLFLGLNWVKTIEFCHGVNFFWQLCMQVSVTALT